MMDKHNQSGRCEGIPAPELADIIDVQAIQSLMDDFYKLAHIPMSIIDLKGEILFGVGWQDICTEFHRMHPEACRHCVESDIQLSEGIPPGEFRLYKCKNNMWDIATPIIVCDTHLGNLFSGQFFFEDERPDYELFRSQAGLYGFDEAKYIAALDRVPRLSRESVKTGMAFLVKLAQMISQLSYSNINLSQSLTEHKQTDLERETSIEFLQLINRIAGFDDLIKEAATFFQRQSGCEAVGIRLKKGDDYPYYEARGFPKQFVKMENSLCSRDAAGEVVCDDWGNPILACMCGNIICGRFDPSKPFFSEGGSFWSNCTTELLATTTEADRQARTRNRCNGEGYESVALIALRVGRERMGLLQLNDRRKGMFTPEVIALWERLAGYLAVALAKSGAEEALQQSRVRYISLFENMLDGYAYCKMIYDGEIPQDFVYVDVNPAFEKLTGLRNVVGKKVTDVIPGIKETNPELFEIYGRAASTRKPERFETYVDTLGIWFSVSAYSPQEGYFVAVFDNITERKKAEDALKQSEEMYRSVVDNVSIGIAIISSDMEILALNPKLRSWFPDIDVTAKPVCYRAFNDPPREDVCSYCPTCKTLQDGEVHESITETPAGSKIRHYRVVSSPIRNKDGKIVAAVEIVEDITEQQRLEEKLFQAQKMEAVGQLAGGIAHDFNNILTAVMGYGHILKMKLKDDAPLRNYAEHILSLSERAAKLTQSLLAFSRKQIMNPKPLDINEVIRSIEKWLSKIIGEDIQLQARLPEKELIVMADGVQIEQALINLVTNARDAMPRGGLLTIETENVHLDSRFTEEYGYGKEGQYALISVSDTGAGIDKETKEKIFDPFFTTKEVGKGTGLGLAMVYGTIKQHEGYINVYSEPGQGTAFRIYLPLIQATVEDKRPEIMETVRTGTETVLLAEDETEVRAFLKHLLEDYGYKVIEAADGKDAVDLFYIYRDKIHLLLFDIIMPRMNGRESYGEIRKIAPDIKAIFMSGYNADIVHRKGIIEEGLNIITKPVLPDTLLREIRETLDKRIQGE